MTQRKIGTAAEDLHRSKDRKSSSATNAVIRPKFSGKAAATNNVAAAERAKEWREQPGYDFSKYHAENKDRINAQRRARRKIAI